MAQRDRNLALHFSEGKSAVDEIPPDFLLALGDVFTYGGSHKYFRYNWARGNKWHEFIGSALRHIYKWMNGEKLDKESGLHHILHAVCNLIFLWYYEEHSLGEDDRINTVIKENL